MLEDNKKYRVVIMGIKVENILYFIFYFELRIVGKHRKDVGGHGKGCKLFFKKSQISK
jgi:hypothetical protein